MCCCKGGGGGQDTGEAARFLASPHHAFGPLERQQVLVNPIWPHAPGSAGSSLARSRPVATSLASIPR